MTQDPISFEKDKFTMDRRKVLLACTVQEPVLPHCRYVWRQGVFFKEGNGSFMWSIYVYALRKILTILWLRPFFSLVGLHLISIKSREESILCLILRFNFFSAQFFYVAVSPIWDFCIKKTCMFACFDP